MSEQELLWWDSEKIIQSNALAFFDRHLRGVASEADDWSAVRYQRGEEWLESDGWPPADAATLEFYLGEGTLQPNPPSASELDFPYDPEDPSPTIGGQALHYDFTHGPDWQDDIVSRSDALVFVTEPLDTAVELSGPITAGLEFGTTGIDTHVAIRITDVHPDGRHLLLTDGIRRMSLYENLSTLNPIVPGEFYTVPVNTTNPLAWRFEEGHRIGLIVTSSNYRRFERASNTGTVFYDDATAPVSVMNTLKLGESSLNLKVNP
jgi:putative CocE/NonD family hydrolase